MACKAPPTINTPRLRLRRFVPKPSTPITNHTYESDLAFFHDVRTTASIIQWSAKGAPDKSLEETAGWMEKQCALMWAYVVELAVTNETGESSSNSQIGSIGLHFRDQKTKGDAAIGMEPEVGFMLATAFQGHGYATEGLKAIVDSYWKCSANPEEGSRRQDILEAFTDTENTASCNVLRKLGFKEWKKVERDMFAPLLNSWRDALIWRLARPGTGIEITFQGIIGPDGS